MPEDPRRPYGQRLDRPPGRGAGSSPRRFSWRLLLLGFLGLFALLLAFGWSRAKIPASGSRQQVLYYSAPTSLRPGARMESAELIDRLTRLGYHRVEQVASAGEFSQRGSRFEIYLHPFNYIDRPFGG